jgi:multisubunit Na+/H+ antiporter MnhB subunit
VPVSQEIARLSAALRDLETALGVALGRNENANGMTGQATVPPERWKRIDQARLDGWFSQLGAALEEIRCELQGEEGGPEAMTWVATPSRHDRAALEPLLDEARNFGSDVDVTVRIKKKPMEEDLAELLKAEGAVRLQELRIAVFFSAAALEGVLSRTDAHYRIFETHFLEAIGPASPDRLLLILVADVQGRLRGPYLAILGSDHLDEAADFLAAAGGFEVLVEARGLMSRECLWDQRAWLLTPDFFSLPVIDPGGLKACRSELRRLQNELSLPYLANWTLGEPGNQEAKFEGNRSVRIGAEKAATAPHDLYVWAYADPKPARSKLEIVRRVVASRLPPGTRTFAELIASAADLLSECGVQLRVLMDDNLADSFERRERIEKLVRDYVDQVSRQIESLSKEVVDNIYKTVGLLVAVALAYLLKPDGGTAVLVLGVTLYVAYILFILLFYLRSLEQEHQAKKEAFDQQKQELVRFQVLTSESLERLRSVTNQETKLQKKLKTVRVIYWGLVAAAVVLLLGWLSSGALRETPEAVRRQALDEQAGRFKRFGYRDVRADAKSWPAPAPLVDAQGRAVLPDATAIRKGDSRFLVLAWVPCERIKNPAALQDLRRLHALAEQEKAELQIVTEAVCGEEAGPERLRAWLGGEIPGLKVWTL